jgi:hypothetical protein
MIMKKTSVFLFGLAAIVLATGISAFGQEKQTTFDRQVTTGFSFQGPGQVEPGRENMFTFVNSEFSFDKLVKGAPYSAQAVTEMTQILSDGNRIVNTNTAAVYRDGEGRTRREQTLRTIGNFSAAAEPVQSISINDPVAGVAYVLEPHSHMARKIQGLHIQATSGAGYKVSSPGGEGENFTFNTTPGGVVQLTRATVEARTSEGKEKKGWLKEDLGTQTIEGVNATGTRTTITIPAGQIGNERAIEIIDERWFSADLQTMVMTRHSDPRSGETVYRLTNINRVEPDHSLFEVPADYTVHEQQPMRTRMPMPAKPDQQ